MRQNGHAAKSQHYMRCVVKTWHEKLIDLPCPPNLPVFSDHLSLWPCSITRPSCRRPLQHDDRDSTVAAAEIGIALQFGMRLQKLPCGIVRLRPVFSEDAAANLAVLRHLQQTILDCDANFASGTGRSVAVNELQQLRVFLAGERQFALEALQGLADQGHIGFEVDGLHPVDSGQK